MHHVKDLSPEQRREALRAFDRYFEKVDARRKVMSEMEEETLITEALRSVRPTYRPLN